MIYYSKYEIQTKVKSKFVNSLRYGIQTSDK